MDAARRILRGEPPRSVLSEQLTSSDLGTGTQGMLGAGRFVSPFSSPNDLISTVFQLTDDSTELGSEGDQIRVQGVLDDESEKLRLKNIESDNEFDRTLDEIRDMMDAGTLL